MKMLKATVSGSFRTQIATDKDRHQFSNVSGIIPAHDWEYHIQHAMRMFPIWIENDKNFEDVNFEGIIKLRVDNVEEVDSEPTCLHKNIKELSWEDLQSLACYKKLREIPLYKKGDIRRAREKAYEKYEEIVNGKRVFKTKKQLKDFKSKMEEQGLIEGEINRMISDALNMITDDENPEKSYNFTKLPDLYVDGKKETSKTEVKEK